MSARIDLRLSADAGNLATFGADGGLGVEDPSLLAVDSLLNFFTFPNHLTTSTAPVWWRNVTGSTGNLAMPALTQQAIQPLLVTRDCLLTDIAVRVPGWNSGPMYYALYQYSGQFARFSPIDAIATNVPTAAGQVITCSGYWNRPLKAGTLYMLGYSVDNINTIVQAKALLGNPWGEVATPTSLVGSPNTLCGLLANVGSASGVLSTLDVASLTASVGAPHVMLRLQNT